MKKLLAVLFAVAFMVLGIASTNAAGFDGTSVVEAADVTSNLSVYMLAFGTMIATVLVLAPWLITKGIANRLIGFVLRIFGR